MALKAKRWCFTLNNYTPVEDSDLVDYCDRVAVFAIVAYEIGANKTPHLQGYINHRSQVRLSSLKKVSPRAHWEVSKGSDEENLKYCSKQDPEPYIVGEPQSPGKRNDLKSACSFVLAKKSIQGLSEEFPEVYVKFNRGFEKLAEDLQSPRDPERPPLVVWLWGKSGVGKTRLVYDTYGSENIYVKDGTQWWNNYFHQQVILVDDLDGRWPFRDFLRFLDRYPYQGQSKGGYVVINSPVIVLTCEFAPEHFWSGNELEQVSRRLTSVYHMD